MPDMKPRSLDTVKKYISDHNFQKGMIVSGGEVGAFAEQYISIHNNGFDIFTLYDKEVKTAEPYSWSDFNQAEIDRLALSARIKLNGARSVYIRVPEIKEVLPHLESHEIRISYIQRKWYRKILGFRSGKRWKMITAGIGYLLIILLIMGFFVPNGDQPSAQNDKSKAASTLPAKQVPKSKSTEDKIKAAIQENDAFNKTFDGKNSIISFNFNKDNGFVFAQVYGQDNLSASMIRDGMWMNTTAVLKHIKQIKEVKEIALNVTFPMQDKYGKKSDMTVMKMDFKRQTIDKIDFNNFQSDNIPTVADQYWQQPSFSK